MKANTSTQNISEEDVRIVKHFIEYYDDPERYADWEIIKDTMIQKSTALSMYLDYKKRVEALRKATLVELDELIDKLEES